MKPSVLIVHNRYIHQGGEERYVAQLEQILSAKGHRFQLYTVENTDFEHQSLLSKCLSAFQLPFSIQHYKKIRLVLQNSKPDVIHIHNIFPLISPAIYYAAAKENIPTIQSLHNYRFLCANGLFLKPDGSVCEQCATQSHFNATRFRCYGGRFWGSLAMSLTLSVHRALRTFDTKISAYIAPSRFLKEKYIEAGYPEDRIHLVPSAISSLSPRTLQPDPRTILYVGRLSREKGLRTLLESAKHCPSWTFQLAGDGPIKNALENHAKSNGLQNVQFLGHQEYDKIQCLLQKATFLVLPSECYENLPMVIMEAWQYGLPVIASRLGGMAEAIENGVNGYLFEHGNSDSLIQVLRKVTIDSRKKMEDATFHKFLLHHSIEPYYEKICSVYKTVIDKGNC